MKFDKNYDYSNILNDIRSSSFYRGYLIAVSKSIQNTGHVAGNEAMDLAARG